MKGKNYLGLTYSLCATRIAQNNLTCWYFCNT